MSHDLIKMVVVFFGTTITLMNIADDSEITYQIVGEDEADIALVKSHVIRQSPVR